MRNIAGYRLQNGNGNPRANARAPTTSVSRASRDKPADSISQRFLIQFNRIQFIEKLRDESARA